LNTISTFGCGLLASGVGIGYWIYGFTKICYHSFYPLFVYVTFLAGLFQEEDLNLRMSVMLCKRKIKDISSKDPQIVKAFLETAGMVQFNFDYADPGTWETAALECKTGLHALINMRSEAWVASHVREIE
jgi:hypothetical protein